MLCLCEVNRFLSKFLPDHAVAAKLLDWGGRRFSWASQTGTPPPPPLYVSFLSPNTSQQLATQANTKQGYPIVSVINIHAQSMCCAQDGLNILGALILFPPSIVSASTRKTVWMIILHSLSQGLKTFYTE